MLLKLIKHNLGPIFKAILPFIVVLFASVLLFSFTAYETIMTTEIHDGQEIVVYDIIANDLQQFLHGLSQFMISCSLILLVAVAIRTIWRRFKSNFYGDEAYLTHTLPIPRHTLWNARVCIVLITFVSIIFVAIINCLILALTRDGQQLLESLGLIGGCSHCVGAYYYIEPLSLTYYLSYIFVALTEFIFLTFCGLFGIILSNHFSKNIALLSGIGVYFIGSLLVVGTFFLISNFDPTILNMLHGPSIASPGFDLDLSFMARALSYIGIVYTCHCVILYFTNRKLLNQGVNLD